MQLTMDDTPRRLLGDRPPLLPGPGGADEWNGVFRPQGRVLRRVRAVRRAISLIGWTMFAVVVQSLLICFDGSSKVRFARLYWRITCRLIGMRMRVIGIPARTAPRSGRPVVFVSNHSSWLDIAVLGAQLYGCFVSKDDVADWPIVSTVARLGRTVFVSRKPSTTGRERDDMRARLAKGDNLVLFPEGTTSDGSRVLPFRSSFISVAQDGPSEGEAPPLLQPVSIVYDRLAGLPAGRWTRPLFAYYGDMSIGSHFWRLAQWKGLRASVIFHPALDPRDFADRKALTQAAFDAVASGAASLRQNRMPGPQPEATPRPAPTPALAAAFSQT